MFKDCNPKKRLLLIVNNGNANFPNYHLAVYEGRKSLGVFQTESAIDNLSVEEIRVSDMTEVEVAAKSVP